VLEAHITGLAPLLCHKVQPGFFIVPSKQALALGFTHPRSWIYDAPDVPTAN